jgi:hypothetical protein
MMMPERTAQAQIPAAPPANPIRQAPQPGLLQGAPQGVPGYVEPDPAPLAQPRQVPLSQEGKAMQAWLTKNQNNPYAATSPTAAAYQLELQKQKREQDYVDKVWESTNKTNEALKVEQSKQRSGSAEARDKSEKTQQEIQKLKDERAVFQQYGGMPPEKVFDEMTKAKDAATKARAGLVAANDARTAIENGAITGSGAETKLNLAKILTGMGLPDKGNIVANTETFRSAMAPIIASVLQSTVGSANISNTDREFAAAAAGGSIALDANSIRRIIDIVGRGSRETLDKHQTKVDVLFGKSPQGKALFGVDMPDVEKDKPLMPLAEKQQHDKAAAWLAANPNDPRAPAIRKKLGLPQ